MERDRQTETETESLGVHFDTYRCKVNNNFYNVDFYTEIKILIELFVKDTTTTAFSPQNIWTLTLAFILLLTVSRKIHSNSIPIFI